MKSLPPVLRSAAIALTLAAGWPAASPAQTPAPAAPIPAACAPTALAIRAVNRGPAPIVFLSINEPFKAMDQDTMVGKFWQVAPAMRPSEFRDFYKQIRAGDDGAFDMACPWASYGVQVASGGEPIRVIHPLVSRDGREALVMLRVPGEDEIVWVCNLRVVGKAWTLVSCGRQRF